MLRDGGLGIDAGGGLPNGGLGIDAGGGLRGVVVISDSGGLREGCLGLRDTRRGGRSGLLNRGTEAGGLRDGGTTLPALPLGVNRGLGPDAGGEGGLLLSAAGGLRDGGLGGPGLRMSKVDDHDEYQDRQAFSGMRGSVLSPPSCGVSPFPSRFSFGTLSWSARVSAIG